VTQMQNDDDSPLIFPMLFCYRHFVELCVKALLFDSNPMLETKVNKQDLKHQIKQLTTRLNQANIPNPDSFEMLTDEDDPPEHIRFPFKGCKPTFEEVCTMYASFDSGSYRFRYPVNRNLEANKYPSLIDEIGLSNASELKDRMGDFDDAVEKLAKAIGLIVDSRYGPW